MMIKRIFISTSFEPTNENSTKLNKVFKPTNKSWILKCVAVAVAVAVAAVVAVSTANAANKTWIFKYLKFLHIIIIIIFIFLLNFKKWLRFKDLKPLPRVANLI